jgi:hypothetical protein
MQSNDDLVVTSMEWDGKRSILKGETTVRKASL